MNRKRREKIEQASIKHSLRVASGQIKDKYPEVSSIKIKKRFVDFDTGREFVKEPEEWNVPLTAHALLDMDCPLWECVDGGFDLTDVVREMIKNRENEKEGEVKCPGWQDEERRGKFHCYTKMKYKISIIYSEIKE